MSNILKKCGKEVLVSCVRKEVIWDFTYFVRFGIILSNRWTPQAFCLAFVKETVSIIQIFNTANFIFADWFFFSLCLTNPLKNCAEYGKYTDLQTYFSEKSIWRHSQFFQGIAIPKFQRNRSFISNVIGCGYLSPLFCRNIPAFHKDLKPDL